MYIVSTVFRNEILTQVNTIVCQILLDNIFGDELVVLPLLCKTVAERAASLSMIYFSFNKLTFLLFTIKAKNLNKPCSRLTAEGKNEKAERGKNVSMI